MKDEYIVAEVKNILSALGDSLPEFDRLNVSEFLTYGEYGLAVDTLCQQMAERDVVPSRVVYEQIMRLVEDMGMDVKKYRRILPQPGSIDC